MSDQISYGLPEDAMILHGEGLSSMEASHMETLKRQLGSMGLELSTLEELKAMEHAGSKTLYSQSEFFDTGMEEGLSQNLVNRSWNALKNSYLRKIEIREKYGNTGLPAPNQTSRHHARQLKSQLENPIKFDYAADDFTKYEYEDPDELVDELKLDVVSLGEFLVWIERNKPAMEHIWGFGKSSLATTRTIYKKLVSKRPPAEN